MQTWPIKNYFKIIPLEAPSSPRVMGSFVMIPHVAKCSKEGARKWNLEDLSLSYRTSEYGTCPELTLKNRYTYPDLQLPQL